MSFKAAMNTSFKLLLITLSVSFHLHAQDNDRLLELNRKVLAKQAESKRDLESTFPSPVPSSEPAKPAPTLDDRNHYISDGNLSVMIPRGAVIHLPEKNRITLNEEVVGKLVEWDEFFFQNRNAVRLQEVNIKQLQGSEVLDEKAMERIKLANFPTLTSYQNRVVALAANRKLINAP